MEPLHKKFLIANFPESQEKIIVLDIPDIYFKNDPEKMILNWLIF